MRIRKDKHYFGVDYDFNILDQLKEEQRRYTIFDIDPISKKNEIVVGEIILRGFSVKLDEIEEKIINMEVK